MSEDMDLNLLINDLWDAVPASYARRVERAIRQLEGRLAEVDAVLLEWKAARGEAVAEGATPDRFTRLAEAESMLLWASK